ncbi:MAG: hypothetical protein M1837_002875 [Sclerophora amabilis]|nr:MAG: hypothetical protein M1837_002875 [Sclerophora amabilis]
MLRTTFLTTFRSATATAPRAFFSTSPVTRKSATDTVKEAVKKADRTVSDAAVGGIEKGESMSAKAKEAAGIQSQKAQGKAEQVKGQAEGKAEELKGEAKEKAADVKSKM